jgi:hypothetical protein
MGKCRICDKRSTQRCGFCKHVYYCSRDHQQYDWWTRLHSIECVHFAAGYQYPSIIETVEELTSAFYHSIQLKKWSATLFLLQHAKPILTHVLQHNTINWEWIHDVFRHPTNDWGQEWSLVRCILIDTLPIEALYHTMHSRCEIGQPSCRIIDVFVDTWDETEELTNDSVILSLIRRSGLDMEDIDWFRLPPPKPHYVTENLFETMARSKYFYQERMQYRKRFQVFKSHLLRASRYKEELLKLWTLEGTNYLPNVLMHIIDQYLYDLQCDVLRQNYIQQKILDLGQNNNNAPPFNLDYDGDELSAHHVDPIDWDETVAVFTSPRVKPNTDSSL